MIARHAAIGASVIGMGLTIRDDKNNRRLLQEYGQCLRKNDGLINCQLNRIVF